MTLAFVGGSHRTVPMELRERLAFSAEQAAEALRRFRERFPGREGVLLSTCNRVELYAASEHDSAPPAPRQLVDFLAECRGIDAALLTPVLAGENDQAAVHHLFSVASGLDSMVLGEPQIVAQVKQAWALAQEEKTAGPLTGGMFQAALRTAKRVATETAIGRERLQVLARRLGFGADAVDYLAGWELQRQVHANVVSGRAPDTVLLLEHQPVYTAGRRTETFERPFDGTPVIDVDRGGKITWHGPGQLVGYPIVRLPEHVDVVAYVRRIERTIIDVCAELGVETTQVVGRSGVWVAADGPRPWRKVAAIGIRVIHGVTMHGFALNCDCDLSWFDRIVPCGISDADVTSLSRESGRDVTVAEVLPLVERRLTANLEFVR